jgi:hypothetical protein
MSVLPGRSVLPSEQKRLPQYLLISIYGIGHCSDIDRELSGRGIAGELFLAPRISAPVSGGRIIILRGTRLRLDRGARIEVPPGCRLVIGKQYAAGAPASLDMRRNARLTVHGRGSIPVAPGSWSWRSPTWESAARRRSTSTSPSPASSTSTSARIAPFRGIRTFSTAICMSSWWQACRGHGPRRSTSVTTPGRRYGQSGRRCSAMPAMICGANSRSARVRPGWPAVTPVIVSSKSCRYSAVPSGFIRNGRSCPG